MKGADYNSSVAAVSAIEVAAPATGFAAAAKEEEVLMEARLLVGSKMVRRGKEGLDY